VCVVLMLCVYLRGSRQWRQKLAASPPQCD
jgi:hypothetical protein